MAFTLCIVIPLAIITSSCNTLNNTHDNVLYTYTELGNPTENCYNDIIARNAWDMMIFDNKLFVGSGNYTVNSGPTQIAYLDLFTNEWSVSTVPDDEINNFVIIDNTLIAPGIDPIDNWDYGNYYFYNGKDWSTIRSIPNGVHNFCMLEYHDIIFCGLGISKNGFPIASSTDIGQPFQQVPFYKNNTLNNTTNSSVYDRVYELFVANDQLYAVKGEKDRLEIFAYNNINRSFEYINDWTYKILWNEIDILIERGGFFSSVTFQDSYYFSTGLLYKTADARHIEHIELPSETYVVDLYVCNNNLYILGIKFHGNGTYTSCVYMMDNQEPVHLLEYTDSTYAISFAVDRNSFYIALGYDIYVPERSGMIIKLTKERQK